MKPDTEHKFEDPMLEDCFKRVDEFFKTATEEDIEKLLKDTNYEYYSKLTKYDFDMNCPLCFAMLEKCPECINKENNHKLDPPTPTLEEKVKMYEDFLHKINLGCVCCNHEMVRELVGNADKWSYAHRAGNGMITEEEQQEMINARFYKLCSTPQADAAHEEMKKKRSATIKNRL